MIVSSRFSQVQIEKVSGSEVDPQMSQLAPQVCPPSVMCLRHCAKGAEPGSRWGAPCQRLRSALSMPLTRASRPPHTHDGATGPPEAQKDASAAASRPKYSSKRASTSSLATHPPTSTPSAPALCWSSARGASRRPSKCPRAMCRSAGLRSPYRCSAIIWADRACSTRRATTPARSATSPGVSLEKHRRPVAESKSTRTSARQVGHLEWPASLKL
mmetsp:Transcript_91353/g.258241  ORF Transcript_91353/g.258241 Transcript_91353/m.258241 type:complete len:215 (+) Transcript_91353:1501-2145(+)